MKEKECRCFLCCFVIVLLGTLSSDLKETKALGLPLPSNGRSVGLFIRVCIIHVLSQHILEQVSTRGEFGCELRAKLSPKSSQAPASRKYQSITFNISGAENAKKGEKDRAYTGFVVGVVA